MLSFFICPYTHWRRMILPTDPRLSTIWYVRCTYWMFVWMLSTVLSIINVLSFFTCPYTQWKRMVLPSVQRLLRAWYFTYIYIGCLYEWFPLSCQSYICYPASHVPIHIENEWSYLLIHYDQLHGISNTHIGCFYEWSQLLCQLSMCYPTSPVPINLGNEWSYLLVNFYQ